MRSITRDHPPFQTTCPKQRCPPLLVFALPSCKHNTSVEAFVLLSPDSFASSVERVLEGCYSPFPCRKPVKTYGSKFTSLRRSSPRSGRESGCGRECGRSSSTSASATSSERYPAQTAELVRSAIPPLPPLVIAHITTSSACAYSQGRRGRTHRLLQTSPHPYVYCYGPCFGITSMLLSSPKCTHSIGPCYRNCWPGISVPASRSISRNVLPRILNPPNYLTLSCYNSAMVHQLRATFL